MIKHYLIRQGIFTKIIFKVKSHQHSPFISIFQSHLVSRRTAELTEVEVCPSGVCLVLMLRVSNGRLQLQLDEEILKASTLY
jgi:hypothetical protein